MTGDQPPAIDVDALIDAHERSGYRLDVGGIDTFVPDQGHGQLVVCLHGVPASSFLYRNSLWNWPHLLECRLDPIYPHHIAEADSAHLRMALSGSWWKSARPRSICVVIYFGPTAHRRQDHQLAGSRPFQARGFFVILRLYNPLQPLFDKTW